MRKLTWILLTAFLTLSCGNKLPERLPETISGKVIGVTDGDTIEILYDGKPLKIRFAHVDCPEIRNQQPFGRAAKTFISDKCFGKFVTVNHKREFDRYNRLIAEIVTEDGTNLNKELMTAGLAWHYTQYSTNSDYATLEIAARSQRIGIWSENNPTPPWNWRNSKSPRKKKS